MQHTLASTESYFISNIKLSAFVAFTKPEPIPDVPKDKVLLEFPRFIGRYNLTDVKIIIEDSMKTIIRFIKRIPLENVHCRLSVMERLQEFHTVMSCNEPECSTYNFCNEPLCNHYV